MPMSEITAVEHAPFFVMRTSKHPLRGRVEATPRTHGYNDCGFVATKASGSAFFTAAVMRAAFFLKTCHDLHASITTSATVDSCGVSTLGAAAVFFAAFGGDFVVLFRLAIKNVSAKKKTLNINTVAWRKFS